ncbi:ribonuclease 3-like protein 2 [Pyrus x bretschneideri]|uniref:ribonuclease 3-like protein 2 n=1 Tax=Pyrus x bretschneideri TaxID=225117 RepID=UPI000870B819|nr:ribonuclease 3-like protein 2 [Pyrus x bretschneideri]XP_048420220.1 ribonuclease 3-like protein 2 [Pyrus x bretschneideri]
MKLFTKSASLDRNLQPSPEMKDKVMAMEKIVGHNFKNKRLLEEALTHSSITCSPSYKRLAVLGDATLELAMSNHLFLAYPNMDQDNFTNLRSANVNNVKFALAAVKHGFYGCLNQKSSALDDEVGEFAKAVSEWNEKYEMTLVYDGTIQPNHVLGDIVESVAAAIYIDLNFDLDKLWMKFKHLLEPIITLEGLLDHPVSVLYKLCQTHGKFVKIKGDINDTENLSIASVYVDGILIASASYKHMAIARLHAARKALPELSKTFGISSELVDVAAENEAKQNLNVLCDEKRIPRPTYNKEKESGPVHEKRFVSSVEISTLELKMMGDERSRIKDAENSAAALMILGLLQSDAMTNTKEAANSRIGYFPSVLYRLWVMIRWVTRLLVFCFKGISLLVIFFTVVELVIG